MDLHRLGKTLGTLALIALGVIRASAQTSPPYQSVVFFRDKAGSRFTTSQADSFLSAKSLQRRQKFGIAIIERDRPVSQTYIAQIRAQGVTVLKASKWLNAVVVTGDSTTIAGLGSLPFVSNQKQVAWQDRPRCATESQLTGMASVQQVQEDYGIGTSQAHMLGIDSMHAAGLTGKGVLVAVLDAGYDHVLQHQGFTRLADSAYLADSRDFVGNRGADVFGYHWHGGAALSCIGGYYPGNFIGGAYQAKYALYVTEDVSSELPVEGFNWAIAAERADSLGVDLISTSLGYSTFDRTWLNYTLDQLDGHTTLITQAVNAATQTGMLCITSAGNEGQAIDWRGKITAPADAELGLTVGAVGSDSTIAAFSSRGIRGRQVKPDVVAQGVSCSLYSFQDPNGIIIGSGTSFSCPLVSGLIAGMMQKYPRVSPAQWINALHRTSTQSTNPDTSYGYGIPNFNRLDRYLSLVTGVSPAGPKLSLFPNPQDIGQAVRFVLDTSVKIEQLTVFNLLGQPVRIWHDPISAGAEFSFSTEGLAAGTYVVRTNASSGIRWAKLVLK